MDNSWDNLILTAIVFALSILAMAYYGLTQLVAYAKRRKAVRDGVGASDHEN